MADSLQPSIDPELKRQLAKAKAGELLQAVYTLRTPAGKKFLEADETRTLVERLLKSAQKQCGVAPAQVNVFANLQSFALSAPRELIETLSHTEAIASATANVQSESMLIEPVRPARGRKKDAKSESPSRPRPRKTPRSRSRKKPD